MNRLSSWTHQVSQGVKALKSEVVPRAVEALKSEGAQKIAGKLVEAAVVTGVAAGTLHGAPPVHVEAPRVDHSASAFDLSAQHAPIYPGAQAVVNGQLPDGVSAEAVVQKALEQAKKGPLTPELRKSLSQAVAKLQQDGTAHEKQVQALGERIQLSPEQLDTRAQAVAALPTEARLFAEGSLVLSSDAAQDPALNPAGFTQKAVDLTKTLEGQLGASQMDAAPGTLRALVDTQAQLKTVQDYVTAQVAEGTADPKLLLSILAPKDPALAIAQAKSPEQAVAALKQASAQVDKAVADEENHLTLLANGAWAADHPNTPAPDALRQQTLQAVVGGNTPFYDFADAQDAAYRAANPHGVPGHGDPVIPGDNPDPAVLKVGNEWVMTNTGGNGAGIFPVRVSNDLVNWRDAGAIFSSPPQWASGDFWAPEIHRVGNTFIAVYSARNKDTGRLAIGLATSNSPTGPFVDRGSPIVSNPDYGIIDANLFHDPTNGKNYIIGKDDTNDPATAGGARPTRIWIHELDATGTQLTPDGNFPTILTADQPWENNLIEGPEMFYDNGSYHLMVSGNGYASPNYAEGLATAPSPFGPFQMTSGPMNPGNPGLSGDGHYSPPFMGPDGKLWVISASWTAGQEGYQNGGARQLILRRFDPQPDGSYAPVPG